RNPRAGGIFITSRPASMTAAPNGFVATQGVGPRCAWAESFKRINRIDPAEHEALSVSYRIQGSGRLTLLPRASGTGPPGCPAKSRRGPTCLDFSPTLIDPQT